MSLANRFRTNYLLLLLIALLLFGKSFTKYNLVGPLYLYDFLLVLLVITCFLRPWGKIKYKFALYFSIISVLYFLISLAARYEIVPIDIIVRQFAICGYFISAYIIAMAIDFERNFDRIYWIVIVIAKASFLVQAFYILYLIILEQSLIEGYNYYSPLTVMGLLVFAIYTYFRNDISRLLKSALLITTVFFLFTVGHASALLPMLVFLIMVIYLRLPKLIKASILVFGIVLIIPILRFLPYVLDVNSAWRLVFWKQTLNRIIFDRFVIFGHGFGIEYVQRITYDLFVTLFHTHCKLDEEGELYVKSVHNSFLAIALHVGFLPIAWLFVPVVRAYKLKRQVFADNKMAVIFFSLIVLSVWCFFNVILELPHSSLYYWLFYFMLAAKLNDKYKNWMLSHER